MSIETEMVPIEFEESEILISPSQSFFSLELGDLWGEPVAVVGNGAQTQRTAKLLLERLRLGIRPVVITDDTGNIDGSLVPKLTMDHFLSNAGQMRCIQTAVLVDSELSDTLRNPILEKQSFGLKRLIYISDFSWMSSLGVTPYDLEGLLGLEISYHGARCRSGSGSKSS